MGLSQDNPTTSRFAKTMAGFLVLPCLAIAFLRLFARTMSSFGVEETSWFFVQPLTVLLLVVLDKFVSYGQEDVVRLVAFAAFGMAAGGVATALPVDYWILVCGHILRNVCSGILIVGIGYYLCSIELRFAVMSIVIGFTLNSVFAQVVSVASADVRTILAPCFALAAGFCLAWGLKATALVKAEQATSLREIMRDPPWTTWLILPIFILYLFREIVLPDAMSRPYDQTLWIALHLVCLMLVFVWVLGLRREDPSELLPVFLLTLFFGPLFYIVFNPYAASFSEGVFQAISKCYMMVAWIYLVFVARRLRMPVVRVFGLGHFALMQAPRLLRQTARPLVLDMDPVLVSLAGTIVVFATAISLCVVLAVYVLGIKKKTLSQPEEAFLQDGATGLSIDVVAEKYRLSARESEVVAYLTRGYSLSEIGKRLFVSTETVRTHCKNIYRKAGVHGKQEFLALLEKE